MKKLSLLFLIAQLSFLQEEVKAVTAYPYPIEFTQPDGSIITVLLKGDEKVHWALTSDGYTLMFNSSGTYEYAMLNDDNEMVPSGIKANNIANRSSDELIFLTQTPKALFYSKSQISVMKQIWDVYNNAAKGAKGFPTTGTRKYLLILANFNNTSTTYTQAQFNNYMNQVNYNSTGSFRDYYLENSYGQLTVNTTVTVWVTVPNTHDYYGPDTKWGEFAYEAVKAANPTVDYSQYDNDGDGIVDGVAIIHQGRGQEESGNVNDIWSHSWDLASAGYNATQRTFDGVRVYSYTANPEKNSSGIVTIGVMCHEFGHTLGAPDFYDTDYATGGQYDGTGDWDLQAGGSWNGAAGDGATPAHSNPYTKTVIYGWATATTLSSGGFTVTLYNAAENSNSFYRYNTATSNEYFLIENRQKLKFDAYLPYHGMIIYHVDGTYISSHSSSNDINAGSHQGMYPVCANAAGNPPTTYGTINGGGCPFPGTGTKTTFSDATTPHSHSWAGANTNAPLITIAENAGVITFCFITCNTDDPTNLAATPVSSSQINLSWNKNTNNDPVMVAYNLSSTFGTPVNGTAYSPGNTIPGGGTVIYNGAATTYNHTSLNSNTTYYYKAWSVLTGTSYSSGVATSATTLCDKITIFPYNEGFENSGFIPNCWSEQYVVGSLDWTYQNGGKVANHPAAAHTGSYNASFYEGSYGTQNVTKLVSPSFDFSSLSNPQLKFWHTQEFWSPDQDILKIYYKTSTAGAWTLLTTYNNSIATWTQETLSLPNPSNDYYIAFEGTEKYGYGICIDDVNISGTAITTGIINGSPFCAGAMVDVPFTVSGSFNAGNVFTAQLSDATGSFTSPVNIGTLTSTVSGTINATLPGGAASGVAYRVRVISSNPAVTGSTNTTDITINAIVVAGVNISANPSGAICEGTSVIFTATPTNGGTPTYQWKKGGTDIPLETNSTYTSTTLVNNDAITCEMTSTESCVSGSPAISNEITMIVNTNLPASVIIAAVPSGAICEGTSVIFTATPTNGGTPTYQWKKGGTDIPLETNSTYTSTTLVNNDVITCVMTSNATCPTGNPATSNTITMTVNPNLPVSVSIAAVPAGAICAGTSVTFTATPVNGGTTPTYQWKKNSSNISGATSSTYTSSTLANGDTITCVMTSNATCVTGSPATSNDITMTVNSSVAASISIAANPTGAICTGTSVTFTATPTNGGITPTYQWQLNGSNVGTGGTTYTSTTLNNNDIVTCVMTSNATCVTGSPATSNSIIMSVSSALPASVSIAANPSGVICTGTSVTFTATPTNGGTTPTYQWKNNGSNISGATNSTYTSTTLANGNVITCVVTSSLTCVTGSPVASNSITMSVSSSLPASVSIVANPTGAICSGTSVTFTATPTNGGTTPTYQWKNNGTNISGATTSTYTSTTLANTDVIVCVMTSSVSCATGSPATSNSITMIVNSAFPASVSIAANPSGAVCSGTSVTFTATPTNGGTTPTYQWKNTGSDISGATNSTYTSSTLANGDIITCVMTSNVTCVTGSPATSNAITMTVNVTVTASVSIAANPTGAICTGTSVTFTATVTNGGTTPTYQWKNNGSNISGATNSTYTSATLADADVITCVMTSNANCVTGSPATSNSITMSVSSSLPASVSIAASPATTTCPGTEITFTATPVNGGTSPSYQWQVNGSNVGTDSISYSFSTLNDGDVVSCIMTSSSSCATGSPATSNSLTITIASLTAAVIISASPGTNICSGVNATFTATAYNGGFPSYQWKLNGSDVGTNSSTYFNSTLADNDVVYCVMTSSESCATNNPATSNSLTVYVSAPVPVSVSIAANPSGSICSGTSVTFTATPTNGGTSPVYQWKVNSANVGSNSSTYTTSSLSDGDLINCLMISSISCVSGNPATSNIITITINPAPTANAGNDQTICAGSSATLTASGGVAYIWSNGDTTQSITVTPVATTTYSVVVTNNSCTDSDDVVVSMITVPAADFTANDTTVGTNENVVFSDHSTGADLWEWHFGDGTTSVEQNPFHSYSDDGFYTVILVVSNTEGCSDTLTMTEYIHVYGDAELFIPLCFTPNNDGENDVLFVRGSNIDNHIEFTIFDQWGIIIFESNNVSRGWDGTYLGTAQPIGNYIYRIKITSLKGDPLIKDGIVSLVR